MHRCKNRESPLCPWSPGSEHGGQPWLDEAGHQGQIPVSPDTNSWMSLGTSLTLITPYPQGCRESTLTWPGDPFIPGPSLRSPMGLCRVTRGVERESSPWEARSPAAGRSLSFTQAQPCPVSHRPPPQPCLPCERGLLGASLSWTGVPGPALALF